MSVFRTLLLLLFSVQWVIDDFAVASRKMLAVWTCHTFKMHIIRLPYKQRTFIYLDMPITAHNEHNWWWTAYLLLVCQIFFIIKIKIYSSAELRGQTDWNAMCSWAARHLCSSWLVVLRTARLLDDIGIALCCIKDDMQRFFLPNWLKVVSNCLLQYKPVCVTNFAKLRRKMLKKMKMFLVFLV